MFGLMASVFQRALLPVYTSPLATDWASIIPHHVLFPFAEQFYSTNFKYSLCGVEHPPCGCHDRRGRRGMSNGCSRRVPMRFRTSAAEPEGVRLAGIVVAGPGGAGAVILMAGLAEASYRKSGSDQSRRLQPNRIRYSVRSRTTRGGPNRALARSPGPPVIRSGSTSG